MAELAALNEVLDEIRSAGSELVVISPEQPEHSRKLIETRNLNFEILHDDQLRVAEKFQLDFEFPADLIEVYQGLGADLPKFNGTDKWRLPMPARYIVNQAGVIESADVNADYTIRPEPAETVNKLRELASD